jgi:hydrogenase 3 maturation protease
MGHPFRGDDYAGSYIVKTLMNQAKDDLFGKIRLVDAEDNVEAIIGKIAELGCRHVVFVDTCEMKGRSGETHLIPVSQTTYPFFTTHGIPLKLIADRLLPESQVWLLAIQPKNTDFGEDLSPEIRDAANSVSNFIRKLVTEERSS